MKFRRAPSDPSHVSTDALAHGEGLYNTALFHAEGGNGDADGRMVPLTDVESIARAVTVDYLTDSMAASPTPLYPTVSFALLAAHEVVRRGLRRAS